MIKGFSFGTIINIYKLFLFLNMFEKIKESIEGTGFDTVDNLVLALLNFLIGTAAVISVAVLVFSGYMYITASGDEAKIEKATKSLTYAIVGLGISFIAVLLVRFVIEDLLNPGEDTSLLLGAIA